MKKILYTTIDRSKLPRRALFTDTGASASAAAASSDLRATHTIAGLNPFNNKYTIKARVVRKSELRSYTNSRGSGHVFDVILQVTLLRQGLVR